MSKILIEEFYKIDGTPCSQSDADIVRIVRDDGSVIIGFPIDMESKERKLRKFTDDELEIFLDSEDWIKHGKSHKVEYDIHKKLADEYEETSNSNDH